PILFFLNIGISKKGKLSIVISSLLIAISGLLAQWSYPLWQTVLILLLLITTLSYLLHTRFEKFIYMNNEDIDFVMDKDNFTIYVDDEDEDEEEEEEEEEKDVSTLTSLLEEKVLVAPIEEESLGQTTDQLDLILSELEIQPEEESLILETLTSEEDYSHNTLKDGFSSEVIKLSQEEENELLNLLKETEEKAETIKLDFVMKEQLNLTEETDTELVELPKHWEHSVENVEIDSNIENPKEYITVDFANELEEITPLTFKEKLNDEIDEESIVENVLDVDEIIPLKEFTPVPNKETVAVKKELPLKKQNYLSEIEKLLEEV
ncbi:MAG TPA: hypothetical protein VEV44_00365, partial [Pseudoneobacillus sp.]|nr:hypothetical protein [Pseudoneobacillus sp.]